MLSLCLIEDNQKLWTLITEILRDKWFSCDRFLSWEAFFESAIIEHYHMFLIDVMLPGCDWFSCAKQIRSRSDAGIIFLTAKNTLHDKTDGFGSWADDYLVKPFAITELLLRIEALSTRIPTFHYFLHGTVMIDQQRQKVQVWSVHISLTPTERAVLNCLIQHKGMTCPRSTLLEDVWWGDALFSMSRALDVVISQLRKKLGASLIETVSGVWYKIAQHREK